MLQCLLLDKFLAQQAFLVYLEMASYHKLTTGEVRSPEQCSGGGCRLSRNGSGLAFDVAVTLIQSCAHAESGTRSQSTADLP